MKTDSYAVQSLRAKIMQLDNGIRQRHPFLKYQSLIGVLIALSASGAFLASSTLYFYGYLPMVLTIVLNAFFCSFMHELEHDTFHMQYFSNNKFMNNALLMYCWLFKPNTVNPWVRKKIHLHHHIHSGTQEDIEERLIGNGLPYTLTRFLVMIDHAFCVTQFGKLKRESKAFKPHLIVFALFPMHAIFTAIWLCWAYYYGVSAVNDVFKTSFQAVALIGSHIGVINFLMVVYVAPALLRSFSLLFITSSIHYFKGVDSVLKQTQVLTHWYFLPFQLFCCFFGETHSIHHIWVPQPFYLRHLIRKQSFEFMQAYGVRFNDLGTFTRQNNYEVATEAVNVPSHKLQVS